jgi:uridine kinase
MVPGVVIGICGGTGSGKTTFAQRIVSELSAQTALLLQQDHYYKELPQNLTHDEIARLNFDHPEALDFALMTEHVRSLKDGKPVLRPVYDFTRHQRESNPVLLEPRAALVVEGILILQNQELRELLDIKIFVNTDADIRFIRRLDRDIRERGRTLESVVSQYLSTVRPMHNEFVEPSKRYADVIITDGGQNGVAVDLVIQKIRSLVGLHKASAAHNS